MKLCRKYLPITKEDHGASFVVRSAGKLMFTPLFLVIVLIETTDLIFAVDSIPAAFAITQNEFIVYTSNIFAVMGLRAMFFLLAGIIDKFYLLQKGLSIILFFIGAKMLLEIFDINVGVYTSFSVILATLTLSIVFSVIVPRKPNDEGYYAAHVRRMVGLHPVYFNLRQRGSGAGSSRITGSERKF